MIGSTPHQPSSSLRLSGDCSPLPLSTTSSPLPPQDQHQFVTTATPMMFLQDAQTVMQRILFKREAKKWKALLPANSVATISAGSSAVSSPDTPPLGAATSKRKLHKKVTFADEMQIAVQRERKTSLVMQLGPEEFIRRLNEYYR